MALRAALSLAENFFVASQRPTRRSRAHNISGRIKNLLRNPKRCRRISVRSTVLPFSATPQPFSHRSHPRLTRLHHKAANPVARKTFSASATPASAVQNPQYPSQPQSHAHASVPIDVTFPQRLPELPCKHISLEVLASLNYTLDFLSQYIHGQTLNPPIRGSRRATYLAESRLVPLKSMISGVTRVHWVSHLK